MAETPKGLLSLARKASERAVPIVVGILYVGFLLYAAKRGLYLMGHGSKQATVKGLRIAVDTFEERVLGGLVPSEDLMTTLQDVKGLQRVKDSLRSKVIYPLLHRGSSKTANKDRAGDVTGILLEGPAGTGKTMLARALAREINGYFLALDPSIIFDKYVGQSERTAAAIFTVAEKLGNCVIFLDEADALLSSRDSYDHTITANVKNILLSHWDGLKRLKATIIIVAATNRSDMIDQAFLRRLPFRLNVPLPEEPVRADILASLLADDTVAPAPLSTFCERIAAATQGFSGSDLKQLCNAAREEIDRPFYDALSSATSPEEVHDDIDEYRRAHPITVEDFRHAASQMGAKLNTLFVRGLAVSGGGSSGSGNSNLLAGDKYD